MKMVVARFNEDLSWINLIDPYINVCIYNKGAPIDVEMFSSKNVEIYQLENVGRESESYLRYIYKNSFRDDGYTIFTQGDPFEHSPKFIDLLQRSKSWNIVQPLSIQWLRAENIPPELIINKFKGEWIEGELPVRREIFSLRTWIPISFFDKGAWGFGVEYKNRHYLPDGVNIASHFFNLAGLKQYAEICENSELGVFSYGAIFAVKNSRILEVKDLIGHNLNNLHLLVRADKNYGYIMERLWLHLFGEDFISFN